MAIILHLFFLLCVFLPCLYLIFGVYASIMTCHWNQSQDSLALVITTFLCPGGSDHHSSSYSQPSLSLVQPSTALPNSLGATDCCYVHLERGWVGCSSSLSGGPVPPLNHWHNSQCKLPMHILKTSLIMITYDFFPHAIRKHFLSNTTQIPAFCFSSSTDFTTLFPMVTFGYLLLSPFFLGTPSCTKS